MRGAGFPPRLFLLFSRITPAYAGSRVDFQTYPHYPQDHPRVCGEQIPFFFNFNKWVGSPPRMRGAALCSCSSIRRSRITPAYAGSRITCMRGISSSPDHPRVCGEQSLQKKLDVVHHGSPPRMRGAGGGVSNEVRSLRITPAYAGSRRKIQSTMQEIKDHPRVCGEQAPIFPLLIFQQGSPPRMRGAVVL